MAFFDIKLGKLSEQVISFIPIEKVKVKFEYKDERLLSFCGFRLCGLSGEFGDCEET